MTELKCTAKHCIHNADSYCCKGEILVEGSDAIIQEETFCDSFDERRNGAYCNVEEHPSRQLEVHCDAISCIYNQDRFCHAARIEIQGPSARTNERTECASFHRR